MIQPINGIKMIFVVRIGKIFNKPKATKVSAKMLKAITMTK